MRRTFNDSTWNLKKTPRGKHHNKTETKTTVSLYLNRKLIEQARKQKLNLSRVAEQALSSILDYLDAQNPETSSYEGSAFLNKLSFPKKVLCRGPGLNSRPMEISPAKLPFFQFFPPIFEMCGKTTGHFWKSLLVLSMVRENLSSFHVMYMSGSLFLCF